MQFISIEKYLNESKADNLRAKYSQINDDIFNRLNSGVELGYLDWALKQFTLSHSESDIIGTIESFKKYKPALKNKDLYSYKDLKDLENQIKDYTFGSKKRQLKDAKEGAETTALVYSDEIYDMYIPTTHAESRVLCFGAKWCISMNERTYWNEYRYEDGIDFFFIRNKSFELEDPESMWALVRKNNKIKEIYDFNDNRVTPVNTNLAKLPQKIKDIILNYKPSQKDRFQAYKKDTGLNLQISGKLPKQVLKDENGKTVSKVYKSIKSKYEYFVAADFDGRAKLIDKNGNIIDLGKIFKRIDVTPNWIIGKSAQINGVSESYLYDRNYKLVKTGEFISVSPNKQFLFLREGSKIGIIKESDLSIVVPIKYDDVNFSYDDLLEDTLIKTELNKKVGFYILDKEIEKPIWSFINDDYGFIEVMNNKSGFKKIYRKDGKLIHEGYFSWQLIDDKEGESIIAISEVTKIIDSNGNDRMNKDTLEKANKNNKFDGDFDDIENDDRESSYYDYND